MVCTNQSRLSGNAVPLLVGVAVGRAVHELLRRFIREADAPGAPWPPVDRRRVHVIVDGTRAELEELLGDTVTASET